MISRPLPLNGIKAISLASLGPGPYAAMLLADLGCDVTIVDRIDPVLTSMPLHRDPRRRGQRSIAMDLKKPEAQELLMEMIGSADILLEGMRPGVAEQLGLSPESCLALNPKLIFARITGWGQDGPLAQRAGHDINYIALSGALHAMGDADRPPPVPLNLLGDYAGGGMFVALGVVSALYERVKSGKGQVIDGAMIDGVASLSTAPLGILSAGIWQGREENVLDGGAPYYRTYATSDGGFVAVGAIEPKFFAVLLKALGLEAADWPQNDRTVWPAMREVFKQVFASQPRRYWEKVFDGVDACVSPVLTFSEASHHPHHAARGSYTEIDGITQPSPAPRMSAHKPASPKLPPDAGANSDAVLIELGRKAEEIETLRGQRIIK
ncbi:MAG: CaiB/BaiF CoA transferase family protein [Qipengyuania pacifica]